jgi:hypothetical protein
MAFNTLRFLEEVYGEKSWYYSNISYLPWSETGNMIISAPRNYEGETASKHTSAFINKWSKQRAFYYLQKTN